MNGNHGSANWQWLLRDFQCWCCIKNSESMGTGLAPKQFPNYCWRRQWWFWGKTTVCGGGKLNNCIQNISGIVAFEELGTTPYTELPNQQLSQHSNFGAVTKHCCPSYQTCHYASYPINMRTDSSRCHESKRGRSTHHLWCLQFSVTLVAFPSCIVEDVGTLWGWCAMNVL